MPRRLTILGAALILLSAIVTTIVPMLYEQFGITSPLGQQTFLLFSGVLRFLSLVLPPFGASLLAVGLILRYQEAQRRNPVQVFNLGTQAPDAGNGIREIQAPQ
ncbi:hypothetical protein [Planctomonas deserti]|uniref:hypothetical protein n=1 Tax=Planctomonas deserti TaxID=2144185 RepID=UPI000D3DB252|nr:hypothetical protein [Planctomonas deserti]